jgi:purine catabolism regulator
MAESDGAVMTVRAALALPPIRRGQPELVAGASALERPIRWVASGDVAWIARDLKGGELLLTTGLGIGRRAREQRDYIDALCERSVAAVAIELGEVLQEPPRALVEHAERRGLPVIALRRGVPFVEITEAIHSEIVNRQYAFLRRGDAIHRRFTDLVLEGQGIPEVMASLAAMISDPVVLENARGELLHHATHGAATEEVLAAWEAERRQRARGRDGAIASVSLPLPMGDGAESGRLTALAVDSPLDDYDRVAVERAVGVIALALLRARQEDELVLRGRGEFLAELAAGALEPGEARRRAESLGLVHRRATLLPLAVAIRQRPRRSRGSVWAPIARPLRLEIDGIGLPALLGDRPREGDLLIIVGLGDPTDRAWVADRLAATIHAAADQELGGGHVATVAVAGAVRDWEDAARALQDAADTAASARENRERPWHDASEPDVDRLLWVLRDSPDLRRFAERRLAPLLDHDVRRKNKLLPTLDALCEHNWQKAAAARALHLQRQALYHRVERIARLLAADLEDPRTRFGLELAVRAHRNATRGR